jgi:hypothetical protein
MSRRFAGIAGEPLELLRNLAQQAQHVLKVKMSSKYLKLLAIPAGLEPATHGVEIRFWSNYFNSLGALCTIDVPSVLFFEFFA